MLDFRPESGRILDWSVPVAPGLRWDGWVETGSEIGIHYDSLLGKLIAHGADRNEAIRKLGEALGRIRLAGINGNLDLLTRAVLHPDFAAARIETGFIADHADALLAPLPIPPEVWPVFAAYEEQALQNTDPSPWAATDNWRHGGPRQMTWHFAAQGQDHAAVAGNERGHHFVAGKERWLHLDDRRYRAEALGPFPRPPRRKDVDVARAGEIHAPMPGRIVAILVAAGDDVTERQVLLRLEAMKMEHALLAPIAGKVTEIPVAIGDLVGEGALLARVVP